jgi:uncharacterized protein (DUF2062 family)
LVNWQGKQDVVQINPRRAARYYYLRLMRLQGTPYSLAMGAAIGAAIAVTPTIPFRLLSIVTLTLLLRVSTLAALLVGSLVSNPCTFWIQYYVSWRIGTLLFPGRLDWEQIDTLLNLLQHSSLSQGIVLLGQLGLEALLVLLSGGFVLALPTGILTYGLSMWCILRFQHKKKQKYLLNKV